MSYLLSDSGEGNLLCVMTLVTFAPHILASATGKTFTINATPLTSVLLLVVPKLVARVMRE